MLGAIKAAVLERGWRRVALLGTRFTIETGLFGRLGDIEIVMPEAQEIEHIHKIYTGIVAGGGSTAELDELRMLARRFISRDGAQAILIAATDLSPILNVDELGFPALDCARVHIDAITRRLLD
jgi:aspartate racemase